MRKYSQSLASLGLLLALSACTSQATVPPTPTASATPLPSVQPSTAPTASATPLPSAQPSTAPTASATPRPSVQPSTAPTASATPEEPSASPEASPTPPALSRVAVRVRDEDDRLVRNVQITARSLDQNTPYERTQTLGSNETYVFDDLPPGILVDFSVTAPGYNQQTRRVSTRSDLQELRFEGQTGISSRPEVVRVEPGIPAQLNVFDPITLHFSESIDRKSLQDSIALQLEEGPGSGSFLVGTVIPQPLSFLGRRDDSIYDSNHFRFDWKTDREVTITPIYGWPVALQYGFRLILNYLDGGSSSGGIKDNSGLIARMPTKGSQRDEDGKSIPFEDGPFRVGNTYRAALPITIRHNNIPRTELSRVIASDGQNDSILLRYNQPLSFNLTTGDPVVGGADGSANSAPAGGTAGVSAQEAIQNYSLSCNGNPPVPWPAAAAAIFVNPNEIRLIAPTGEDLFQTGDDCSISNQNFRDTFGKTVQTDTRNFRVQ